MALHSDTFWIVALPVAMCGIGLFLFAFYGFRLYVALRRSEDARESRLLNFSGWAGGSAFIGGAMILLLPTGLAWSAVLLAVILSLAYFPVAAAVQRRAGSRSQSP